MDKEFLATEKDIDELKINKANASDVYTKEEVINKITEKVSEIVADAPEDFDTLKEMSDWINNHEGSAASMNTAINTNKTDIANIQTILSSKVDKEEGKSLISDSEIARLANVENYDDTQIKNDIALNRTTLGYQRKNLLKNETGNTVMGGVTFTHNSDGSVTLNGTSDGQYFYTLMSKDFENILGKKCILTGCPANGSNSTFGIYIRVSTNGYIYDSGAGVTFTTDSIIWISIVIRGGVTFNNVTFYPMLRYADITDDTYEPYKESVDERFIQNKSDIAVNKTTLGYQCKNLLNETEYLSSIGSATNGTLSKSDNSITLTATSNDCYTVPFFVGDNGYRIPVSPNTTYILSWESDNSNSGIIHVFMNGIVAKQQAANNSVTKYLKFTTDIDATFITIRFSVKNSGDSITYSNIMLRYADITDDTYEPYKESIDERFIKIQNEIGDIESILSSIVGVS